LPLPRRRKITLFWQRTKTFCFSCVFTGQDTVVCLHKKIDGGGRWVYIQWVSPSLMSGLEDDQENWSSSRWFLGAINLSYILNRSLVSCLVATREEYLWLHEETPSSSDLKGCAIFCCQRKTTSPSKFANDTFSSNNLACCLLIML
jgi:hypothetical protein